MRWRAGGKLRSNGVGVRIRFPMTMCLRSPFQWRNISSVKVNGGVPGKMKENGMEAIH